MQIVTIASQKGGSGKTTLVGHLAVAAVKAGEESVAIIDTDPQGSLTDWWNEREDSTPLLVNSSVSYLADDIEKLRVKGVKLLIIDTPPAITTSIQSVIQQSDLVLIPTRPSPHDLRAVGATVDMTERAEKPLIFIINAAVARAKLTVEAAIALSHHGAVAPTIVHNRQDFAASMINGKTALEINKSSRSKTEIEALWHFIDERLKTMTVKPLFRIQTNRALFGKRPSKFRAGLSRQSPTQANGVKPLLVEGMS
ncbi:ParA family protein [Temperatibacter marinus]|uniref:ParA family protein n=1 Tax=Temperatibacter marinus TaxID=1456591 RepID=A0AA52HA66_9PROT|nr:ParA family protein [Temperatibacter marinus]WND03307.1 ParA family protein [Temperatibacter marinus]